MNTTENTVDTAETAATAEVTATTKTRKVRVPKMTNAAKGKVGRKATDVVTPTGEFTIKDVETLNPNIKKSTVRAHVNRSVKTGAYKLTGETVKSGGRGKPAYKFVVATVA